MTLEDILKRPSAPQILRDKKEVIKPVIYPRSKTSTMYLASLVRKLKSNQALIIPEDYDIIPPGYSALRELHKGDLIKLRRYDSLENSIKDEATAENLFIDALKNLKQNKRYLGYEWQGVTATARLFRIVPFSELYQAQIIYANQSDKEKIHVKPYTGARLVSELGGQVVVITPSVKKEKIEEYEFRFFHVPIAKNKGSKSNFIWFNIAADHNCPEQTYYPLKYGRLLEGERIRTGDEKVFDAHEISAYKKLKEYFDKREERLKIFEDPFFFFTQYAFNLINVYRTQVVKEYLGRVGGYHEIKTKPLNDKEISRLIADQLVFEKFLLEKKDIKAKIGEYIFKKFFNPRNLNFVVWKNGKFAYQ